MSDISLFIREATSALEDTLVALRPLVAPDTGTLTGQAGIVRTACLDADDVFVALDRMLMRPYTPERAVGLRRIIEAGLTQAAECGAACRALGDRDGAVEAVADRCEALATASRFLLSRLVDDAVEEHSSAT